jgi:hypothetical protein
MESNFNKNAFFKYLFRGFHQAFTLELAENILDYAIENHNASRDQLIFFIMDIFPEGLEFGEIAQFADDSILTQHGQEEKRAYIQEHGKQ